jgi:hypothetical protein
MEDKKVKTLELVAIKCDEGFAITQKDGKTYSAPACISDSYLYDGQILGKTQHQNWGMFAGKNLPTIVEKKSKCPDINLRYELIDTSMQSDKIPLVFLQEDVAAYDDEEYAWVFKEEFKHLQSLYAFKSDKVEDSVDAVDFTIEVLDIEKLQEGFEFTTPKSYDCGEMQEGKVTERDCIYTLIDQITIAENIRFDRPCKLSSENSFKIIRAYVKANIDSAYAKLTSDYDFCLTVQKKIELSQCEEFMYDANLFTTKKKPKMKKSVRRERSVTVFECAPKRKDGVYSGYTQCVTFSGKNWEDLRKNIRQYLKMIMKVINRPLVDCPHCEGYGVIIEKIKEKS